MAISEYKAVVRIAETLAIVAGLMCFVVGNLVRAGVLHASRVQPWLWFTLAAIVVIWGISVWLMEEYSSIKRPRKSWINATGGLSWSESRELEQWCPKWLKYSSYSLGIVALVSGIETGSVRWSEGDPFTEREAIAFFNGFAFLSFMAVPCLASASRSPGSFSDIFSE